MILKRLLNCSPSNLVYARVQLPPVFVRFHRTQVFDVSYFAAAKRLLSVPYNIYSPLHLTFHFRTFDLTLDLGSENLKFSVKKNSSSRFRLIAFRPVVMKKYIYTSNGGRLLTSSSASQQVQPKKSHTPPQT